MGFRIPGPQCPFNLSLGLDGSTTNGQPSHRPGPACGHALWPELHEPAYLPAAFGMAEAITDADRDEFAVVAKMPVCDRHHRPYKNVGQYVSDRTLFFGSPSTYRLFAAASDAELADTKWVGKTKTRTLRSMIEFDKASQQAKQQVFYRWVRRAYRRKYGDDTDVPGLIRKGMSDKLAAKIADVRGSVRVHKAHAEAFTAGGFNPRPIKYAGRYVFGTLSEHGTGLAVDVDDARNPQLTAAEWAFVEQVTGTPVKRFGRWATEADATALWTDFKAASDAFVAKATDAERAAAKAATPGHPAVVGTGLRHLLGPHVDRLAPWAKAGFLALPLDLVLELHAHGFTWGATFKSNVDLHHFQLDDE